MQQLPYRFAEKQRLQVEDMSERTNMNKSLVARAAFQIGMEILRSTEDESQLRDKIAIGDARARN